MNQAVGPVPRNESTANAAMPIIDPAMSMAYARSGGMDRRSGPSGNASDAMRAVTRITRKGSTMKFTSALFEVSSPNMISLGSRAWTLSWAP